MLAQPIATLTCIAMYNLPKHASLLYNLVSCAIPQICAIWEVDVGLTPVRRLVVNA